MGRQRVQKMSEYLPCFVHPVSNPSHPNLNFAPSADIRFPKNKKPLKQENVLVAVYHTISLLPFSAARADMRCQNRPPIPILFIHPIPI